MNPILIVIMPEVHGFSFKVQSISKEDVVNKFTANGSDESHNEGMR